MNCERISNSEPKFTGVSSASHARARQMRAWLDAYNESYESREHARAAYETNIQPVYVPGYNAANRKAMNIKRKGDRKTDADIAWLDKYYTSKREYNQNSVTNNSELADTDSEISDLTESTESEPGLETPAQREEAWERLLNWYNYDEYSGFENDNNDDIVFIDNSPMRRLPTYVEFAKKFQTGDFVTTFKEARDIIIQAADADNGEAIEFLIAKLEQGRRAHRKQKNRVTGAAAAGGGH